MNIDNVVRAMYERGQRIGRGYEQAMTEPMSRFSHDPTARGDEVAEEVRTWYEANRESWWDRHRPNAERKGIVADNFMISLIQKVRDVLREAGEVK